MRWCKYPFDGVRSSAGMSGDWGDFASYREYMDAVNEQLLVVPMIETVEALDAIEEILAVAVNLDLVKGLPILDHSHGDVVHFVSGVLVPQGAADDQRLAPPPR